MSSSTSPGRVRPEDVILDDLRSVAAAIGEAEGRLSVLYPRRLALFQEAKEGHGTINRVLGDAASVQETAVIAALRKAKVKAGGG